MYMEGSTERATQSTQPVNTQDQFLRMATTDGMDEVEYTDHLDRKFRVFVRKGGDPSRGIVKGPPVMDALGLDEDTTTKLHNELYSRGVITTRDAMRRPQEIMGALQQAFRANVQQIQNLYVGVAVTEATTTTTPPATPAPPTPTPPAPITPPEPITVLLKNEEDVTDAR